MIEVPEWFFWFIMIGAWIVLLRLIVYGIRLRYGSLKYFFICKYTKTNPQNHTYNKNPLVMKQSPENTTNSNSGDKTSE
jgi:hypothetical protein